VLENEINRIWRDLARQFADLIPADLMSFVGKVFNWHREADGNLSNLGNFLWEVDRKRGEDKPHSVWVYSMIFGEGVVADLPDLRAKCAQLVQAWGNRIDIEVDTRKFGVPGSNYVVLWIRLAEVVSTPSS
jgi:hypothetical protein